MKLAAFSKISVIALALGVSAVGCKTNKFVTPLPGGAGQGFNRNRAIGEGNQLGNNGNGMSEDITSAPGGGEAANFNPDDMNQDREALAADAVYFDFDSASIRPSEQSKLSAVASALNSDLSAKLLIEGNCDERGTEEYNRSLGERRALAAREALAGMGVNPDRVATRSYGEDRPADTDHTPAAWAKNRRDEFVLLHPK
ncbi:MAG TPA: OmpA family protein [Verrucomicrobiae bacterium]|nr:OmpA family protein [Verrucomicrobiae bacterium]